LKSSLRDDGPRRTHDDST